MALQITHAKCLVFEFTKLISANTKYQQTRADIFFEIMKSFLCNVRSSHPQTLEPKMIDIEKPQFCLKDDLTVYTTQESDLKLTLQKWEQSSCLV